MNPDIWQRLEAVFLAARETPPDAHEAFLSRPCAGDVWLRGEVEAMLAADAVPTGEGSVGALLGGVEAAVSRTVAPIGARLGAYLRMARRERLRMTGSWLSTERSTGSLRPTSGR